MRRVLVVAAVEAERLALARGLDGTGAAVLAGGVGMAAAAATTARALALAQAAGTPYHLVVSAGIAGGFGARDGVVLGARSVAADLGAETDLGRTADDGFLSLDALGFGSSTVEADPSTLDLLRRALPEATVGDILTVSTVSGTADAAERLLKRYPGAVAEAMEGFGAATAAALAGAGYAELRTISNPVGPRDRASWRIREALAALTEAATRLAASLDR